MIKISSTLSLLCFLVAPACGSDFTGWQGIRVIEQKGYPNLMRAADLTGDGQEELIVVNSRSSRLDIYSWREELPTEVEPADEQRPNDLPMATDFEHQELQLESVPRDVLAQDLDGDGQPELIVLVATPDQVAIYRLSDQEKWEKQYKIDLLDSVLPSRREALLIRPLESGKFQLLVSLDNGIQKLMLQPGGRAEWLTPREQRGRVAWWLADLDGDGRDDLIEQTRESNESVRWYRTSESGTLTPAAVLLDRAARDVEVLQEGATAQLAVIDGTVSGILRRYKLDLGFENPLGQQRPLALENGEKQVWCGLWQDDKKALIVADSNAPRLLSYELGEAGWETQKAFPAVTDILSLESLAADPGALLLWKKDAADLRISRWESGRLTYPEPWPQSAEEENRKILALDRVGPITWWVQKVGKHLDLYLAKPSEKEPEKIRFAGVGTKADQVLWIGGSRLLLKETHSRALKLLSLNDEKVKVSSPTHLKKATLAEFRVYATGDEVHLGRLTNGVMQWLGEDLRSHEQVMLPHGQELADYVVENGVSGDEAGGWALQRNSPFVHRIQVDASRLSQSVEKIKLVDGTRLMKDPVLGMLLLGSDRVTQLSKGRSPELKLVEVIDERVGRKGGVRKTRFHQLSTTDIDRDGYDDLLLFDQIQHRLTVLGVNNSDNSESPLEPKIAWPVFDDMVYPYSDDSENQVSEPRAVLAADFDGDQQQDLALLSHDRLILYIARELIRD